ncbi:MAG: PRC-barrel domain-containing protein [Ferruginibacter sp.]
MGLNEDNLTGNNTEGVYPNLPLKVLTATSIIGDKVHNRKGEHLGQIKEIMINVQEGSIEYFIIEFGGFLGIGEKLFAIPFKLLEVDPENQAFIFDQKRETLENAPGFDKEHWPETNIHYYDADAHWSFI